MKMGRDGIFSSHASVYMSVDNIFAVRHPDDVLVKVKH
jgi:uncharacterized UPF0146 family protein